MPKQNINWLKTIMYKFVCNDLNIIDVYTGSTTDFISRKSEHKYNCNNPNSKKYNLKIYQTIRENGGWDNWSMILIEEYPCNSSLEARSRERYHQETLNASLNMRKSQNTDKEYYIQNKEKIDKYNKQKYTDNNEWYINYRKNNREKINEYAKNYREKKKQAITI